MMSLEHFTVPERGKLSKIVRIILKGDKTQPEDASFD